MSCHKLYEYCFGIKRGKNCNEKDKNVNYYIMIWDSLRVIHIGLISCKYKLKKNVDKKSGHHFPFSSQKVVSKIWELYIKIQMITVQSECKRIHKFHHCF